MNEIKVLINFEKRTNVITGVDLTNGDYNSTKIIFEFDRNDGIKIFELKNPKNEVVFSKEIINNEVILANIDENGVFSSIFNMAGEYTFEVSLYANEGKLTSDYNYLNVEQEQVVIGDTIVEPYLPVFDELMQKINTAITETNNMNISAEKNDKTTTIKLTKKDGTIEITKILDGDNYILTEEDKEEIIKTIEPLVEEKILTDFVTFDDVATSTKAGITYTDSSAGLGLTANGKMFIIQASEAEIDAKTNNKKPIVPATLNYAVRSVRPIVSTELPNTLSVNTIYDLGIQTELNLNLPAGVIGDFIEVDFLCDVATNLTITSTSGLSELDLIPEAGMIYSLFFDWGRIDETTYGWRISYAEYVRAEV